MLFKDLKQLGRGRKNAADQKPSDDGVPLETANDSEVARDTDGGGMDNAAPEGNAGGPAGQEQSEIEKNINDSAEKAEQVMVNKSSQNEADAAEAAAAAAQDSAATEVRETDESATGNAEADSTASVEEVASVDAAATDDGPSADDLSEKVEKYREDYLRAVAELQNVKRRSESDVQKAKKYGAESMARGLLDVKDSLDLARSVDLSDAREDAISKMQEGLELTLKQLESVLEKHGVKPVEPEMGDKLDPALHQAMSMQPSTAVKPNHVLAVVQKGYQLHDRLLRAAMVVVATADSSGAAADAAADGDAKSESDQ